jgi:hypothetical protein
MSKTAPLKQLGLLIKPELTPFARHLAHPYCARLLCLQAPADMELSTVWTYSSKLCSSSQAIYILEHECTASLLSQNLQSRHTAVLS